MGKNKIENEQDEMASMYIFSPEGRGRREMTGLEEKKRDEKNGRSISLFSSSSPALRSRLHSSKRARIVNCGEPREWKKREPINIKWDEGDNTKNKIHAALILNSVPVLHF